MSWVYLIAAGLFECFWSTMMKLSEGFSRPGYAAATVVGMIVSFWALILATKEPPISLATPSGPASAPWARCWWGCCFSRITSAR